LKEGVELSLVSIEYSFVTLGSRFDGVKRMPYHLMLHYDYLVLCPCISGISDLHYYFVSFVGGLQGI